VAEALFGRDAEIEMVRTFLDAAAVRGGALLLSGEPGVGKSVLLETAARTASAVGTRVLRTTGVQDEAEVSFSALHQLLLSVRQGFERLPVSHHDALSVALGLGDSSRPEPLVVSNATLSLLRQTADVRPLLVLVDDLQWLDRASAVVLAFVARRLAGSRVAFIAASRAGCDGFFEQAGLPQHDLQPLDEASASRLIGTHFPSLATPVQQRVLAEAEGNPLALVELPSALTGAQRAALETLPPVLPLNDRLGALFATRVADLPAPTRELLLLAALQGAGDLGVLQAAAGDTDGLARLAPAEHSGLISIQESSHRLTFRHPLVRSTVVEGSADVERRRAHQALADALADQPERRAWHLAEAIVGPDEDVAALLEQTARPSLKRGDAVGAVAALTRAADLSPEQPSRSRRLAEAAYLGADVTGELRNVSRLLDDARMADPEATGSLQAAIAASYLILNGGGDVDTAHRLLVRAIESAVDRDGEIDDAVIEALHTLLPVCFFGGRSELWEPFYAAMARLEPHVPGLLSLCSRTFPDPVRTAVPALEELADTITGLRDESDPTRIVRVGIAAVYVDRLAGCREALWRVVQDGREGGAVASAIDALMLLCFDDLASGQWDDALHLAGESVELCERYGYRLLAWPGRLAQALIAAGRGDDDTTRALTDEMSGWAAPRGVLAIELFARHARALAAMGRGDFEEAYQQSSAISPAGALAPYTPEALWVLLDLVESAVRTDRRAEAMAHTVAMRDLGIASISPRLALVSAACSAMLASDDRAVSLYEGALAVPGVERWPFELARVHLCFGEYLRRARAVTRSRVHLKAGLEIFERLGAQPWATRAAGELRAAGMTSSRSAGAGASKLTPQEFEIATLAASGLTNKQIAERLYLSHRTVGAHLYQVFPKLGITSRAALRDALADFAQARSRPGSG
jgi:DNA-binding CsgD family transcriptional regulator